MENGGTGDQPVFGGNLPPEQARGLTHNGRARGPSRCHLPDASGDIFVIVLLFLLSSTLPRLRGHVSLWMD